MHGKIWNTESWWDWSFHCRWTLLHYAVMSRSTQVIKAVIELGVEVGHSWRWDIMGPMNLTPLHMLAVGVADVSMLKAVISSDPGIWFFGSGGEEGWRGRRRRRVQHVLCTITRGENSHGLDTIPWRCPSMSNMPSHQNVELQQAWCNFVPSTVHLRHVYFQVFHWHSKFNDNVKH